MFVFEIITVKCENKNADAESRPQIPHGDLIMANKGLLLFLFY